MTTQNNLSNLTNNKNAPAKRRGKRADHEGSIYYWKARNRWVSCIRLGYNPQTGKEIRKKKYSRTQQEALAALEELKVKYAAVTSLEADTLSVQEWMEKWLLVYVAPPHPGQHPCGLPLGTQAHLRRGGQHQAIQAHGV